MDYNQQGKDTVTVKAYIPGSLSKELARLSGKCGCSLSSIITRAIALECQRLKVVYPDAITTPLKGQTELFEKG